MTTLHAPPPSPPRPPRPPDPPALLERVWPAPAAPLRAVALAAAAAAGLAATAVVDAPVGMGLLVVGALAAGAAGLQRGTAWDRADLALGALAVALLVVAVLRDAEWLVALCVLASAGLGALAAAGARGWSAAALVPAAVPAAALRGLPWAAKALTAPGSEPRRWVGIARAAALTGAVLLVFGALLSSADAAFARVLDAAVPDVELGELPAKAVLAALVTALALGVAYLAAAPPRWSALQVPPGRSARRGEWLAPVVALDLLLLTFLAVQSAVLFGGRDHLLRTAGLTSAEYARQGFGQLLAVTVLVLGVVAAAARWAPRAHPGDRVVVDVALGVLLVLTLAVAVSALSRMHLYDSAFGATRARLFATALELWIVAVLLLVGWVGARRSSSRLRLAPEDLPRAVAAAAGVTLLALAVVNADGRVADRNVDRFLSGKQVDVAYLGVLSADAVEALDRLPEPQRSCALAPIAQRLASSDDAGWAGANAARSSARRLLAERPVVTAALDLCPTRYDGLG